MAKINAKGVVAKKIGMTRVLDPQGEVIPVTLLKVEHQKITKVLNPERDGYHGIQVGFAVKAEKNLAKADISRLRKGGVDDNFSQFREFRTPNAMEGNDQGATLTAELFSGVEYIDVTGVTKGKGFQGAIKRWNSARGRMTHGSMYHRRTGSLGSNTTPGRVVKNKPIPGHMGVLNKTIKNLQVITIDVENNVIAVRGSVPGHREGFVEIRPSH